MRRTVLLLMGAVAALLVGCAEDESATVGMGDNYFEPEQLTVTAGEELDFDNFGQVVHNAIDVDGAWETGDVAAGEAASVTIDEPGTYRFYCSYHAPDDASAGMSGTVTVVAPGDESDEDAAPDEDEATGQSAIEPTGETRRVPQDYPTIQSGVDAAEPGDLVLVDEGTYREQVDVATEGIVIRGTDRAEVVVDGEFQREMGLNITADGVAVENMTVREVTGNGFYWNGVTGFRGSHLTAINSGTYGIYAFDSSDGVFERSYVSGSADGGFYVGQCADCRTILNEVTAERNAFGFSGTNASGSLYLVNSTWRDNGAGIVPNTLDSQRHAPSRGVTIAGNVVASNGDDEVPTVAVTWAAFGNGIIMPGGVDHDVRDNVVVDHPVYGIASTPNIDQSLWQGGGSEIRDNLVAGSGVADVASLAPAARGGDCLADNEIDRTVPRWLPALRGCSDELLPTLGSYRHTLLLVGHVAAFPGDRHPEDMVDVLPEPEPQPQLPGGAEAEVRPAVDVFDSYDGVDLDAIERPAEVAEAQREPATLVAGLPVGQMSAWQAYFVLVGWLLPLAALVALPVVGLVDVARADRSRAASATWAAVLAVPVLVLAATGWWAAALATLLVGAGYLALAGRGLRRRVRWWTLGATLVTVLLLAPGLVALGAALGGVL